MFAAEAMMSIIRPSPSGMTTIGIISGSLSTLGGGVFFSMIHRGPGRSFVGDRAAARCPSGDPLSPKSIADITPSFPASERQALREILDRVHAQKFCLRFSCPGVDNKGNFLNDEFVNVKPQ